MKIKPKKSLGQNFLSDKNIIKKIVDIGKINTVSSVLEIGPGTGNMTEFILKKKPKEFTIIEKDFDLSKTLHKKFNNKVIILNKDFLDLKLKNISKKKLIIYGNLPYNISSEILLRFVVENENFESFEMLIFMFQKEVADRILAKTNSKNYGRLSIISNWKLELKKEFDVSPSSFFPSPKVNSTLLSFIPKKKYFYIKNSKNLEKITRIFFNQRRKMIKNPLKKIFKNPDLIAKKLNLNIDLRPQNLSPLKYFEITKEYEDQLIN